MTVSRRAWLGGGGAWLAAAAARPGRAFALADQLRSGDGSGATAASSGAVRARLSLNENPFGPSPAAIAALARHTTELCRYVESEAEAFAALVAGREHLPTDQIVLGEILESLGVMLGLAGGPGGEIVYSVPGYTALVDAAGRVGGVGVAVPLNQRLENDLPALAARVNAKTRAVFLVNPHNPSGTVSAGTTFKAFVREISQRTLVIVDEAYLEFGDDFVQRTAVDLTRAGANVAVFRTFSKFYGLGALPLGYAAVPRTLAQQLKSQGVGDPRSLNALTLAAATASLNDASFATSTRALVAAERARWTAALDALKLRHTDARGNFVFFETGRPNAEVARAFLAEGVKIGRAFPPLDRWARISIGLPEENALARAALKKLFAP